jgi:hypothetical protein
MAGRLNDWAADWLAAGSLSDWMALRLHGSTAGQLGGWGLMP